MSVCLLTVSTGPSVSFGCREDFGWRGGNALQLGETRAQLSLRDSTCPNPKCSSHSGSIPRLLFLSAAPGVLATPHLLSQTQRGASEARPLEDGSCRPRWLSSPTISYSYRRRGKYRVRFLYLFTSRLFSFHRPSKGRLGLF